MSVEIKHNTDLDIITIVITSDNSGCSFKQLNEFCEQNVNDQINFKKDLRGIDFKSEEIVIDRFKRIYEK